MNAKTASRKAGEIKSFYETTADSIFVVMDGERLISFVDKCYALPFYDESERWLIARRGTGPQFSPPMKSFRKNEALLTTCCELKKAKELTVFIWFILPRAAIQHTNLQKARNI